MQVIFIENKLFVCNKCIYSVVVTQSRIAENGPYVNTLGVAVEK